LAGDSETNRAPGLFRLRVQPELCKTFAQPAPPDDPSEPGFSSRRAEWLNGLCHDWLLRGCKRTFSPFRRGVVTTYALEVGAAGDGDNRDHSFSAFRAACRSIHEILPIFAPPNSELGFLFHSSVSAKQEDSMEAAAVTPPRDPPCPRLSQRSLARRAFAPVIISWGVWIAAIWAFVAGLG
jgi:hypothetical protein